MAEIVRNDSHTDDAEYLENPFDSCEIYKAIHSGGWNKAPGRDGLGIEFYKITWATIKDDICLILNRMFFGGVFTPSKSTGQSYAYLNRINPLRLPTIAH